MNVHERDVPIYAGWADSMISIADIIGLPIASLPQSHVTPLTILQHVRLIQRFSHRQLFVFTLLSSGTVAAMVGFCTSPWQLIALRGMTGLVHFGGFISTIALGGLVDEESRNEGESAHSRMNPETRLIRQLSHGELLVVQSGQCQAQLLEGSLRNPTDEYLSCLT